MTGFNGDTANNNFSGNDILAAINPYVPNLSTTLDLSYKCYFTPVSNFILLNTLVYPTNCESFNPQIIKDTAVCKNEPIQLFASGGTDYEWFPTNGLSCTTCPNPILTTDSSRYYKVRIWNGDSCNVVLPVRINVIEPQKLDFYISDNICGASSGYAVISAEPNSMFSLNNNPFQLSGYFNNLSTGLYNISVRDSNSCQIDSSFYIDEYNATNSNFIPDPAQGAAPLSVNFTNTSNNATDYIWNINGVFQGNALPYYIFDTSDIYTVELIAYNNSPLCSDTFALQIFVVDSLIYSIPNVFTPNADGVNDFFGITVNQPAEVELSITNRWGNSVYATQKTLVAGFNQLWNGESGGMNCLDGTYFYKVTFKVDGKSAQGFLDLRR